MRKSEGEQTVVSTTTALIEAARQAGTLDQLADEARAAADLKGAQKVENAEAFYLLVELARGQGPKVAPRIEARLAELIKENESRPITPINDGVARVQAHHGRIRAVAVPLDRQPGRERGASGQRPCDQRYRRAPHSGVGQASERWSTIGL